jgi:hypothetical protein
MPSMKAPLLPSLSLPWKMERALVAGMYVEYGFLQEASLTITVLLLVQNWHDAKKGTGARLLYKNQSSLL